MTTVEINSTPTEYVREPRARFQGVPLSRLVQVELRKRFDTRSGFWLMASIGIVAVLATGGVILFAPETELASSTYAQAIRFPMAVILPLIAILSITSEWSQRSGLTTFTLVPHRRRVITAKAISSVVVGLISVLLALAIAVLGNLAGAGATGTDIVWDATIVDCLQPWVDAQHAQTALFVFGGPLTGEQWATIAVTGVSWLIIPLVVGLRAVIRSEVK